MSDVLVIGCGLLGTSVGLALRGSDWDDVTLHDEDATAEGLAVARGAGRAWDGTERARLVVVAVPPSATAAQLLQAQRRDVALTYTHVCSIQSHVQAEVEALSLDPSVIVGGHPLAGREVSGPQGAVADLFVGRPWAICATDLAAPDAVEAVRGLAARCGAAPVDVTPDAHDAAVGLLSHLPQVVASGLAGLLIGADERLPVQLSGPGLADTTRLAASDPSLWTEILVANAEHVAPSVHVLAAELEALAAVLDGVATQPSGVARTEAGREALAAFLLRGNAGRALVPVKRGELAGAFEGVRVELADEPGQLAKLLVAAGAAGVNVEDLRVEHVPGRPRGVIELLVSPASEGQLRAALQADGWHVVSST